MSIVKIVGIILFLFGAYEILLGALFFGIIVLLLGLFLAGYAHL